MAQELLFKPACKPLASFSSPLSCFCDLVPFHCNFSFSFIGHHFLFPFCLPACTPSFPPLFPSLLSFPRHGSPLSLLFFALSDMSQDSSDEDSAEEEDFSRVQFGSRYTAARCVFSSCVCLLRYGPAACSSGLRWLDTNSAQTRQGRVKERD